MNDEAALTATTGVSPRPVAYASITTVSDPPPARLAGDLGGWSAMQAENVNKWLKLHGDVRGAPSVPGAVRKDSIDANYLSQ
jgi:hypothetical protein